MNNLFIGGGFDTLILGSIEDGIQSALPFFIKTITMVIMFVTYPATPFIFILTLQLKQIKYMFYSQRSL